MPVLPFDSLPDSSHVWIFGAAEALSPDAATRLMHDVERYLADWKAHGNPLTVGSQLREERFLVVAVDQKQAGATGCSIDGLVRVLQGLESSLGTSLLGGGRVYYRDGHGKVASADRGDIATLAASGAITKDTVVFDTSLIDLGTFRSSFERPARDSWAADLLA